MVRWTAALLLALLPATLAVKEKGVDSFALGDHCILDPFQPECTNYELTSKEINESLDMLCIPGHLNQFGKATALPFMTGCELARSCGVLSDSTKPAVCNPFKILACICVDSPNLAGCAEYRQMCWYGTQVQACFDKQPIDGFGQIHTRQALLAVQRLCAYAGPRNQFVPSDEAIAEDCSTCTVEEGEGILTMADRCPNVLGTLASICAKSPETGTGIREYDRNCRGIRNFCELNPGEYPEFCNTKVLQEGA